MYIGAKYVGSIVLLLCLFAASAFARDRHPVLIGIQPAITVEPFYTKGELDINVAPLVLETEISSRVDLRCTPIVNYHIGGVRQGLSDVGLYTVFPIYPIAQSDTDLPPYGFFVGPVVGFGRNLLRNHYTTTLAIEPGYSFKAPKGVALSLGLQLGASYFAYDVGPNEWVFHWGPKVTVGFWLR